MNTNELTGPALDWAVAKAEGKNVDPWHGALMGWLKDHRYSTNWLHGGPIIEREGISIGKADDPNWWAFKGWKAEDGMPGPTPLIAAMRCYVASRLGDTIDIPEELQ